MRDLNDDDIREYLGFAQADLKAEDFQHRMIGQVVLDLGLMDSIKRKLRRDVEAGSSANDLFVSLWVSAFQMGRECESRLMESHHWQCSERLDHRAACVYSLHVRAATIAAAQRQARTSWVQFYLQRMWRWITSVGGGLR
jgi:hypothetical protein